MTAADSLLPVVTLCFGSVDAMRNSQIIVNDWLDPQTQAAEKVQATSAMKDNEAAWWGNTITGVYGATPTAGIALSEGRAMTSATAYACSRARAETLASLPPIVYQQFDLRRRSRANGSDPWYLLYDEPNPHMNSMTFYELMNLRQVNRGNAFAEIERDGRDRPIYLWPIHPSRVCPRRTEGGDVEWIIYTDAKDALGQGYRSYTIPDRDMLNVCGFGGNGVIAPGIIDMGREEISFDLAVQQYGADFFGRGARPAGVVEHPGYEDDDDIRREFRSDMNRLHSGRENWNQVAILWRGAKYKEMQANPEQAQFLETRGYQARQLCRMWNVPPALIQIFDDYKFNTVDAMIMQFVMTCVRCDAERLEREFNRKILKTRDSRGRLKNTFDGEYFLEFMLAGLLRGDPKKQAETLEIKRRNGIINGNEWREVDNENPIGPQGDKYIVPGGFADLSKVGTGMSSSSSSAGGTDNAKAESTDGDLPQFDRDRLIRAVERQIKGKRQTARGFTLRQPMAVAVAGVKKKKKKSGGNKGKCGQIGVTQAAVEVLAEASDRIERVMINEVARAKAKSQQLGDDAWDKHRQRLQSAVLPACRIYARHSAKINPESLAVAVAHAVAAGHHHAIKGDASSELNYAHILKTSAKLTLSNPRT